MLSDWGHAATPCFFRPTKPGRRFCTKPLTPWDCVWNQTDQLCVGLRSSGGTRYLEEVS